MSNDFKPQGTSRRQFLAGAAAVGAGGAARAGDPLITQVQDWAIGHGDGDGDGVDATPYGLPVEYESDVVRRNVDWLTADTVSSVNFTPIHALDGTITPQGCAFERHHSGAIDLRKPDYRLMINGLVDAPLVFSYADLERFPRETRVRFCECAASPDEIAAWDVDVRPDGAGLPEGRGSVEDGEVLFGDHCAACHGDFGEGVGNWPTLWDYIRRSKPYGNAQSLKVDEVYAIVAYLLYSNDLADQGFVLTRGNFADVVMPNAGGFVIDDRARTEYPRFSHDPCMEDCKDVVKITARAGTLDVTPPSGVAPQHAPADKGADKGNAAGPVVLAAG